MTGTAVATDDEEPPRRPAAAVWVAPVGTTSNANTSTWVRLEGLRVTPSELHNKAPDQ